MNCDRGLLLKCLQRPATWPRLAKIVAAKLLGLRTVCIRADGVTLEAGMGLGRGLWCAVSGVGYEPELAIWLARLEPGNVVVDIGANIGAYAIRAALAVGHAGCVVAFEPHPETAERLRRNTAMNRLSNVIVVEAAASDRDDELVLEEGNRQSSARVIEGEGDFRMRVRATTVDTIVRDLGVRRLDWIKMDIEGAEPRALKGMVATIARYRPRFLFENGVSGSDTIGLLRGMGYRIGRYDRRGVWIDAEVGDNLFAVAK